MPRGRRSEPEAKPHEILTIIDAVSGGTGLDAVERVKPRSQQVGGLRIHRPLITQLISGRAVQPAILLNEAPVKVDNALMPLYIHAQTSTESPL
jgi:hypothetical protein